MHYRVWALILLVIGLPLVALGCAIMRAQPPVVHRPLPDLRIEREFRAAWVATVANIDWPSAPGLPVAQQQQEALDILNLAQYIGLNAIILQVRPQCDALYASRFEPWSYFLTGVQGQAPSPAYDPLTFWTEAAHARGLELHAWFNPYRAHHPSGGPVSRHSVVRTRPELVRPLADGHYWLDPALAGTQAHSQNVILDVVRRYNIDGVHIDDYFYPYPEYNARQGFPDDAAWQAYERSGGRLSRSDWRRQHVNTFVERLHHAIKAEKPHVKFGISPFGIWRPGHPESIRGMDQYEVLYADALKWLQEGWLDYMAPQLYWPIRQIQQSYPVLLGWWTRQNSHGRHVWPGINASRIRDEGGVNEAINQIMIARGFNPENPGHALFSMQALSNNNSGIVDSLRQGPYARDALVPLTPWLRAPALASPRVGASATTAHVEVRWQHPHPAQVFRWVVAWRGPAGWDYVTRPPADRSLLLPRTLSRSTVAGSGPIPNPSGLPGSQPPAQPAARPADRIRQVAVLPVDRLGNVGPPAIVDIDALAHLGSGAP